VPVAVPEGFEAFARAADALSGLGFKGANVTIPHKENAFRYAVKKSAAVMQAGAANMLTFGPDGAVADNSDVIGFKASLESARAAGKREKAVVLGAGGAARAVLVALKDLGFREIIIANRSAARATELADAFGAMPVDWEKREDALAGADLLVNATSLGAEGSPPLELRLDALPVSAVVSDIVANPPVTELLIAARKQGFATADGLTMLMHQAVPAYKAWLGREAVVDQDLRQRLEMALAAGKKR
jgi:shikimate dehydrogenase